MTARRACGPWVTGRPACGPWVTARHACGPWVTGRPACGPWVTARHACGPWVTVHGLVVDQTSWGPGFDSSASWYACGPQTCNVVACEQEAIVLCEGCDFAVYCHDHAVALHQTANFTHAPKEFIDGNRFEIFQLKRVKMQTVRQWLGVCDCSEVDVNFRTVSVDVMSLMGTFNTVDVQCCANAAHDAVWLRYHGFACVTAHNPRYAIPLREMTFMFEVRYFAIAVYVHVQVHGTSLSWHGLDSLSGFSTSCARGCNCQVQTACPSMSTHSLLSTANYMQRRMYPGECTDRFDRLSNFMTTCRLGTPCDLSCRDMLRRTNIRSHHVTQKINSCKQSSTKVRVSPNLCFPLRHAPYVPSGTYNSLLPHHVAVGFPHHGHELTPVLTRRHEGRALRCICYDACMKFPLFDMRDRSSRTTSHDISTLPNRRLYNMFPSQLPPIPEEVLKLRPKNTGCASEKVFVAGSASQSAPRKHIATVRICYTHGHSLLLFMVFVRWSRSDWCGGGRVHA